MPRYFFDLRDGGFFPDADGMELADLPTAVAEARRTLAELAGDRQRDPNSSFAMIEIRTAGLREITRVVETTVIEPSSES